MPGKPFAPLIISVNPIKLSIMYASLGNNNIWGFNVNAKLRIFFALDTSNGLFPGTPITEFKSFFGNCYSKQ